METKEVDLEEALRARDFIAVRYAAQKLPPSEIVNLLSLLSSEQQAPLFRVLPRALAADTFEYLPLNNQEELLKALGQEDVAAILNEMSDDDRTRMLEELPAPATRQLLTLLDDKERAIALQLLGYPEDSVGRFMTPHYIAVHPTWSVSEVLEFVRKHGQDSETLNLVYVVDRNGLLIDDIRMRRFLLADPNHKVTELMDNHFSALKATDDRETAVKTFREADLAALPVTDSDGVLIGIVTSDDILDIAETLATEEMQMFGGSEALDEPYMQVGIAQMVKKRAGWLVILFLGEMLTATAMGFFQKEIERAVVLALFIPLIISSGGNSGSQAATLVIRALAVGEVKLNDWWRVMRREVFSGLALGTILGTIGFLRVVIWSSVSNLYGPHWLLVAFTVGLALVGIVLWGTLSGSMLPLILRKLGFDPAASSAPFVATLVDVTGLVIYFSVAALILKGTLL